MLDLARIQAVTLDLDDTLWPIWPTIARAETALQDWLAARAPLAAGVFSDPARRLALRHRVMAEQPDLLHDLSALRQASIRLALADCQEDLGLAQPAFEVFFEARQQVVLFDDAQPALAALARRFPLVALSNGNADVQRIGLGPYFKASVSAQGFGIAKPDPRIFHAAAAAAGVPPEAVLHVGDDAELDVLGGLAAGMQTVWVNREDKLWPHSQEPNETVTDLSELLALLH